MSSELDCLIDQLEDLAHKANMVIRSGGKVLWDGYDECKNFIVYRPSYFSNGGFYDGNIHICDLTESEIRYALNAISLYEKVN